MPAVIIASRLEENQHLGVQDVSPIHHRECLIEGKFNNLNVFSIAVVSASGRDAVCVIILGPIEEELFSN